MPKYRGDSEDWLDGAKKGRSAGLRKDKNKRADGPAYIDSDLANAVVTQVFPNQCRAKNLVHGVEELCVYRRANVFGLVDLPGIKERTPVAVGDKVIAQNGVIEGVARRKNRLLRPAPDQDLSKVHVLAANIDALVIVASVVNPEFSPGLIDRFLIAAQKEQIQVYLCFTKTDLIKNKEFSGSDHYRQLGFDVFEVDSKAKVGTEDLKNNLIGKTVVFCGHSGVGKTTLLRALTGLNLGKIGEVNDQTGKGKHTTTSSHMLEFKEGQKTASFWIDTPGIKEFGLIGIEPQQIAQYFTEFSKLSCTQNGCTHLDQPDCNAVHFYRYSSFKRIVQSLIEEQKGPL